MTGQCCAKCRRGIKGYGELPCGYNGNCPNGCHRNDRTAEKEIADMNGERK